jgi:hypothetical protein
MSPSKPSSVPGASDKEVQALLLRYGCPMPLHAVRTLLLGNITSPRLDVSPMAPLAQAFGGELPEFASSDEVEEVMRVLVQGLWNRLSEHQGAQSVPTAALRSDAYAAGTAQPCACACAGTQGLRGRALRR